MASFSKIASISHPFDHGENRSVLVFCKTPELKNEAELAGASLVGDVDLVKKVEVGMPFKITSFSLFSLYSFTHV